MRLCWTMCVPWIEMFREVMSYKSVLQYCCVEKVAFHLGQRYVVQERPAVFGGMRF